MLPVEFRTRRLVWRPFSVPRDSLGESSEPSSFWRSASALEGLYTSVSPAGVFYHRRKRLPWGLAGSIFDFLLLPELFKFFSHLGYDVMEMVLADQDSWDRYEAAKWLTLRRWLYANTDQELSKDIRARLSSEPVRHAAYTREYFDCGVFALMTRR